MSLQKHMPRRITAVLGATLLSVALLACAPQPAPSDQVAGQRATPGVAVTPAPSSPGAATPAARATTPTASPEATPVQPAALLPEAVTQALRSAYGNVQSFEGTVRVDLDPNEPTSLSVTMKHWFQQPDNNRLEVTESDNLRLPVGSTLIYDGEELIAFNPRANQAVQVSNPAQLVALMSVPNDFLTPMAQVLNIREALASIDNPTIDIAGVGMAAGRIATTVRVTPENPTPRFQSLRVWLDQDTRVPLRIEAFNENEESLFNVEYTDFQPAAQVSADRFSFEPPQGVQLFTVEPGAIPAMLDFEDATLEEARDEAEFAILQPANLPEGMERQAVRTATFRDRTVVGLFYGRGEDDSLALIQRPASLEMPAVRGTEQVTVGGQSAELFQSRNTVVIDWVSGETAVTLVTTLPRDQALEIAGSLR